MVKISSYDDDWEWESACQGQGAEAENWIIPIRRILHISFVVEISDLKFVSKIHLWLKYLI